MNRIKILGIGILLSIIFAVTAVPTGETNPGGIQPNISSLVEANGCSCHNIGDGDMNNPNSAVVLNLTMPENFSASETYTLTLIFQAALTILHLWKMGLIWVVSCLRFLLVL